MWFSQFWFILAICCLSCVADRFKYAEWDEKTHNDWFVKMPIPTRECSKEMLHQFFYEVLLLRYAHYKYALDNDDRLIAAAQKHANSLLDDFQERYIPDYEYGQSVYKKVVNDSDHRVTEIEFNIKDALHYTEQWPKYNFYDGEPLMDHVDQWAQFAQLVWGGTHKMGVGCASGYDEPNKRAVMFVVVFYEPKGLVPGQFRDNVHPYLGPIDFELGMQSCPDLLQERVMRRLAADPDFRQYPRVLNYDISKNAQLEANRLIALDPAQNASWENVDSSYTSDYGTLVAFWEDYYLHDFIAHYLIYGWYQKLPGYLDSNGTLQRYDWDMWTSPLQIGFGCATKKIIRDNKDHTWIYIVTRFTIPEKC